MNQHFRISQEYKRIFSLVLIMISIVLIVLFLALYFMYRTAMTETESRLVETAQSQARFFESVITHGIKDGKLHGRFHDEAFENSLQQFKDAHAKYKGFGNTGEFTLAKKEGKEIVFLLRHRHFDLDHPRPVAWDSGLAEPMRKALSNHSGTIIGLDYRGEVVVAAYEPVTAAPFPVGIVAKIDLSEVQIPFVRTGMFVFLLSLVLIALGVVLFYRIFQPLVDGIRQSEAKFKNLAEMSSVAIYMTDQQGRLVYVNPLWKQHTGLDEQVASEKGWEQAVHPGDRQWVMQEWQEAIVSNVSWEGEYRFYNLKTDRVVWVRSMLHEIKDPYNRIYGHVGVNVDITPRKEAEEQAQLEMQKRAEQEQLVIQQTKMAEMGEMMAVIIHQWKQPLNVIGLLAQTIGIRNERNENPDPGFDEIEDDITRQVEFMSQTMEDFRRFFKPDTAERPFQPCHAIEKVKEMFKGIFEKKHIEIRVHSHEHIKVMGREGEFMQVMLNLFNNTRDALLEQERKEGQIDCFISHDSGVGMIRIRDNAGGIPEELLPDKLFQSRISTKGDKGTGIGLKICKNIIEQHMNGKIWVQNVENGAEFVLELPLSGGANQTHS